MKEKVEPLRRFIERNLPVLKDIIRRIRHRQPINTVKQRIVGKGNKIVHAHSILSSVIFDINGNDNLVHIAAGCVLNNVLFYIRGDHHQINIGAGCRFTKGGSL